MSFKRTAVLTLVSAIALSGAAFAATASESLTKATDSLAAATTALHEHKTEEAAKEVVDARKDVVDYAKTLKGDKEGHKETRGWVKELNAIALTLKGKDTAKIDGAVKSIEDVSGQIKARNDALAAAPAAPAAAEAPKTEAPAETPSAN